MLFTPVKPMLLEMKRESFDDDKWIFEPKWDGWRILLHKDGDRIEAYTRNGNRVPEKFPEMREIAEAIRAERAVIDCEGVCIRDGRPVFDDFVYRGQLSDPRKIALAAQTNPATFVAFDVLATDRDHTREPLADLKARLEELIDPTPQLTKTIYVEGEGRALHQRTIDLDLEGIVAKRKDSRYQLDTRTTDWLKIKNWKMIDTVILGYRTEPQFALVVGLNFRTVKNKPVAVVEFGFKQEEKIAFKEIANQIHTHKDKQTQWIKPRLCCRIQYLERTDRHMLRTCSFKGFLFEKHPKDFEWIPSLNANPLASA